MTQSKPTKIFMERLVPACALSCAFILCFCYNGFASENGFFQQRPTDSIPKKIIGKVKITVKDLIDGSVLDSVYVSAGSKKGYTDKNGYLEFDSLATGGNLLLSKAGYLAVSKKAKADLTVLLSKRDLQSSAKNYKNGLYERPLEHFSGAATIISGNDLRKVNSLSFVEALKYYDPSFIVVNDNNNGNDPNVTPSVKIRGSYNFPASATIANQTGVPITGA